MSNKNFIITGSTGWFGKTAIFEYWKLFGLDSLINNVCAFSSSSRDLRFDEFNYTINKDIPPAQLNQILLNNFNNHLLANDEIIKFIS